MPAAAALSVIVHLYVPFDCRLLVTLSPLGAVIVSYRGTPVIVTDSRCSASTGVAVIPSATEPQARTVSDVPAIVSAGTSGDLSSSTVKALTAYGAALSARSETLAVTV